MRQAFVALLCLVLAAPSVFASSGAQPTGNAQAISPATDSASFPVVFGAPTGAAVTGTLTTNGDTVTLPISGGQWATARVAITASGTATVTSEISIDGGANWFASAYGKRLDATSPNPQVFGISNTTFSGAQTFEIPLPSNTTSLRVRCGTTGTTTSVTLSGGALYAPGVVVFAVLYEASFAFGVASPSVLLDVSGWTSMQAGSFNQDTGGTNRSLQLQEVFTNGSGVTLTSTNVASGSYGFVILPGASWFMPKRTNAILSAGTGTGGVGASLYITARR